MVPNMKATGEMINKTDMVRKCGPMELSLKVNTKKVKRKEKGILHGQMVPTMWGTFTTIIFTEKECIDGLMEEYMTVRGKIIKCMDMEYFLGQMVGGTKEIILKIKNRDKVLSSGLMVGNIQEGGWEESSMVEESTILLMVLREVENGIWGKD